MAGYYFEFGVINSGFCVGSWFDFIKFVLDVWKYWFIGEDVVFVFNVYLEFNIGVFFFIYLVFMGGIWCMRGYYEGCYCDW